MLIRIPKISAGERPVAARLLWSWVRMPPGAWIFVCCECRVLLGRGLCDELITGPEESYWLRCVVVCDLETSRIGAPYIYDISCLRVSKRVLGFFRRHECRPGKKHFRQLPISNFFLQYSLAAAANHFAGTRHCVTEIVLTFGNRNMLGISWQGGLHSMVANVKTILCLGLSFCCSYRFRMINSQRRFKI